MTNENAQCSPQYVGAVAGPSVEVPLPQYVAEAAREAAWTVIKEHVRTCSVVKLDERVTVLEGRFNVLIGAVIGSGALGGTVGALILKAFG